MNRLYLELAAVIAIALGVAWYTHHERQIGVQQCQSDIKTALNAQLQAQQQKREQQIATNTHIEDTFHETVSAPLSVPAPVVRLCKPAIHPEHVPEAGAAAGNDHASASSGAADQVDIGAPLVTAGRNADAQITALETYINETCLK